jgi:hypothetical protein
VRFIRTIIESARGRTVAANGILIDETLIWGDRPLG